jgi:hypothetical protein
MFTGLYDRAPAVRAIATGRQRALESGKVAGGSCCEQKYPAGVAFLPPARERPAFSGPDRGPAASIGRNRERAI